MADAGFGLEAAARQFNLEFIPIMNERYFLICHDDALTSPLVSPIVEILMSSQFRAAAGNLSGIDVTLAGTVLSLGEAFPELQSSAKSGTARRSARALR